jgi:superoxide oxidase
MISSLGQDRYSRASVVMHWGMVLLFIGLYGAINLADVFDKGTPARQMAKDWHFMLGLSVFALVWVRLVLRLLGTAPPIVPAPPAWQEKAGKALHLALYGIMIAAPLLGWAVLSAGAKPIPFFGWELPALIGPDKALGRQIREVHELLGNLGYFLIGGHAVAALLHHYVIKDNTLRRMGLN